MTGLTRNRFRYCTCPSVSLSSREVLVDAGSGTASTSYRSPKCAGMQATAISKLVSLAANSWKVAPELSAENDAMRQWRLELLGRHHPQSSQAAS